MAEETNPLLRQKNLIGGAWVDADSTATFPVDDPASGRVLGYVPRSGTAETKRAIAAAVAALPAWRASTARTRADLLRKLHQALLDNREQLAQLLTSEQGKPLVEARAEIDSSAAYILWFAEEARRVAGEVVQSPWAERRIVVTNEPVGVVAAITPWNFPSSMLARKLGPALAAGCTVVVKPASQTPFSALAWGVLCEQSGFPPGVINILTGPAAEIAGAMFESKDVRKLTFTGSTEVGKTLLGQAAATVKAVSMELGGNAPFIVFDDADLDRAIVGAVESKFRNSGQTCVCTNRFYVQSGIYDQFVARLAEAASKLKIGHGLEEETVQGPLIDGRSVSKVEELVADAVRNGGRIVVGGQRHRLGGNFFSPTVIAEANATMAIAKEEVFGPVAPVFRFKTEEEVIRQANDTEYGLACYFYTRDLGRTIRVMERLEYGIVGVNEGLITTPEAPFGGIKQSGLGVEGGRRGIEEYLRVKYACIGGLEGSS